MNKRKNRDISIELIRVLACFLVICAHIQLGVTLDDTIKYKRLFLVIGFSDNVSLFMLISGFFLFRIQNTPSNTFKEYLRKLRSFFVKIWLPVVFTIVFISGFEGWFLGKEHWGNICWNWDNVARYVREFCLSFQATDRIGHFWYICDYIKALFWFPILSLLCKQDSDVTKIRRLFLITSFIVSILQDLSALFSVNLGNFSFFVMGRFATYLLLGYEISLLFTNERVPHTQIRIRSLFLYLSAYMVKFVLQVLYFEKNGVDSNHYFCGYATSLTFLTSIGLFCFILSFRNIEIPDCLGKVIGVLGKCSLYIYMFHPYVMEVLNNQLNATWFCKWYVATCDVLKPYWGGIVFYLFSGGVIFILSFGVGILFDALFTLPQMLFRKIIHHEKANS